MAGFFDKLKQGATKVTDIAQQTVEITRISSQISSKKKEIEKRILSMGDAVFQAYCKNAYMQEEIFIGQISEEILAIQKEIFILETKIKELKNEKDCVCGKVVTFDSKFCPTCGNKFEDPVIPIDLDPSEVEVTVWECPSCQAPLEQDAKFCGDCGYEVKS